jgi:Tfp pilus assembly protein FimT
VNDGLKGKSLNYNKGNAITFNSRGLLQNKNMGSFKLCVDDDHVRSITIAFTGRAEVDKTSGDSCS